MIVEYKGYIIDVSVFAHRHYEVRYRHKQEKFDTFLTSLLDSQEEAIRAAMDEIDEECRNN